MSNKSPNLVTLGRSFFRLLYFLTEDISFELPYPFLMGKYILPLLGFEPRCLTIAALDFYTVNHSFRF